MTIKITPSEMLEYYFCPRFIYYMKVLAIPQYEDRRYKVQRGRLEHEKRVNNNPDYLWKKVGAVRRQTEVFLASQKFPMVGLVDEVVTLADGGMAPIDYKFAIYPDYVYKSHKMQMICYCILVEEIFECKVEKGYIFYIREGNKQVDVPYTSKSKEEVLKDIYAIADIIRSEQIPQPTMVLSRCADCTYRNICVR